MTSIAYQVLINTVRSYEKIERKIIGQGRYEIVLFQLLGDS